MGAGDGLRVRGGGRLGKTSCLLQHVDMDMCMDTGVRMLKHMSAHMSICRDGLGRGSAPGKTASGAATHLSCNVLGIKTN